jgi:hypothetical protein
MNELHLKDKEAVEFMIKEAHSPILEFLDRFSSNTLVKILLFPSQC